MGKECNKGDFGFFNETEISQDGKEKCKEMVDTVISDYKKFKLGQIDGCTFYNSAINLVNGFQPFIKNTDWPAMETKIVPEHIKKINWYGSGIQLIYLFKLLYDATLIDEDSYIYIVSWVSNTIYNGAKNKVFNPGSLNKAKDDIKNIITETQAKFEYKQINDIVEQIKSSPSDD